MQLVKRTGFVFVLCLLVSQAYTVCDSAQLLVGSGGDSNIKRFDATTGVFVNNLAHVPGTPFGLTLGGDGMLYAAVNGGINQVRRINPTTGADLGQFTQGGGLASPDGIMFSPTGDLLVVESVQGDVRRFNPQTGAFTGIFNTNPPGQGVNGTRGITYSPAGDLLVAWGPGNRILRYNGSSGAPAGSFASGGGLNYPHGITFGPGGDLFVSGTNNDAVLRYDGITGASKGIFAQGGGLDGPTGLTFGPGGDLFVSSYNTNQVLRYDGTTGAFKGVFSQGNGLAGPLYLIFIPEPSSSLCVMSSMILLVARRRAAVGLPTHPLPQGVEI